MGAGSLFSEWFSVAAAALLLFSEAFAFAADIRKKTLRPQSFRFFTIESNLFAGICALVSLITRIVCLPAGREVPQWVVLLTFTAACAVTVTLMTVVVFLGPTMGYRKMFEGTSLWFHLLCPLIAIVSLILFTGGEKISGAAVLWGILPVVVYGAIYYTEVIVTKKWEDFYGFNRGGKWLLSIILMLAGAALIAFLLAAAHGACLPLLTV